MAQIIGIYLYLKLNMNQYYEVADLTAFRHERLF